MYSRQVEQLARQRNAELAAKTQRPAVPRCLRSGPLKHTSRRLRTNTGWAIVAIGLRIAASGPKHPSVAPCHPH